MNFPCKPLYFPVSDCSVVIKPPMWLQKVFEPILWCNFPLNWGHSHPTTTKITSSNKKTFFGPKVSRFQLDNDENSIKKLAGFHFLNFKLPNTKSVSLFKILSVNCDWFLKCNVNQQPLSLYYLDELCN